MAQKSSIKRLWYDALRFVCRAVAVVVFRIRCHGREHIPATGGALVVSNHQSQLDPMVVGMVFNRHLSYLARKSLFRFAPFRWLIESLDAIPIDRDGTGFGGLKETLRRLKNAEMVLIFPEGTRTEDGEIQPFKPGFTTVARRAGVPILPVAVEGPYEGLPRNARLPRAVAIQVEIGAAIMPEQLEAFSERELGEEIERRVRECHRLARRRRAERTRPWRRTDRRQGTRAGRKDG